MLEVIDKGRTGESHPAPMLFVHGGEHAAWCWDEHFLDFFAAKGYRAVALSLRGHGASSNSTPSRACSIADYVQDVCSVADHLSQTPVIVGHSLGGFVVQKYLESHAAPAAVLVASTPPQGAAAALFRNAGVLFHRTTRHPWLTVKAAMTGQSPSGFNELERARAMFFSTHTPESWVVSYAERLQKEQSGKVALDMLFLNLPKPRRVSTPLLVLGAQCDRNVSPQEVHATARAYRTHAEIFPNIGHDMMLEPGWADIAQRIHVWLCTQGL
jgi:pimeloyl-ACP methyl ester carboxylesterase